MMAEQRSTGFTFKVWCEPLVILVGAADPEEQWSYSIDAGSKGTWNGLTAELAGVVLTGPALQLSERQAVKVLFNAAYRAPMAIQVEVRV